MRDLSSEMAAALSGPVIRPLILMELQFRSVTTYNFNGLGSFDWNGHTWIGYGELLSIASSEEATDGRASQAQITLSGIDPSLVAIAYSDEYKGRLARIWVGAVDGAGVLIADPVPFIFGLMDTIADDDDPTATTYTLTIKTQVADQRFARAWRMTDGHQQELFPGDKGLEFVAGLAQKKIKFGGS